MPYQHYHPTQRTFPVRFDRHGIWWTLSIEDVVVIPVEKRDTSDADEVA